MQTIPSLAMLAILLSLLQKIGAFPAIVALTLYALLPIVRNTLTGLEGVSPAVVEAARGIGMTSRQRLRLVEIPLAMPVIVAGVRTAAVVCVGIATLSAFIGAGGLGQFINRGLAMTNWDLILLGAVVEQAKLARGGETGANNEVVGGDAERTEEPDQASGANGVRRCQTERECRIA